MLISALMTPPADSVVNNDRHARNQKLKTEPPVSNGLVIKAKQANLYWHNHARTAPIPPKSRTLN